MKLTKKLEGEILKTYHTIWDAYLRGDMRTFASILDENCYIIGTAAGEVFHNKKSAVKYYQSTAGQITGKAEFRNRKINVMPADKGFMVNEESDFYLLIDDQWTFYGPGRISSLFHKKNNKWKVIHQHGSFPDSKTEGGEQVNTEKIKAENIQLRDAVKRRTIELENKNRELEIEAAVEKVRARALAMHKSEEIIDVVKTLRDQLFGLDLEGITAVTICLKQADGRIRLWDITDLENTGRYSWDVTFDIHRIDPRLWVSQIWRSKKKIIACEQDSNDLKRTLKWLSQYDKKTADEIRELIRVNKIKHGWHRAVKLANGRLITDFINEPPAEIESILLKMGAAFDLAYKRFLDLKNAEAQTKEAQIQLSLERLRARAMAMYHSDELNDVLSVLFEQFDALGINPVFAHLSLFDLEKNLTTLRITGKGGKRNISQKTVAIDAMVEWKEELNNWKASKPSSISRIYYPKEVVPQIWRLFSDLFDQLPGDSKIYPDDFPAGLYCIQGNTGFGYIGLNHTREATDEEKDIILRFATEFGRVYQRFLDLKNAEAQTREAQIEVALERVRARTMAMHKSSDLLEVVKVLGEQLESLHVKFDSVNFNTDYLDKDWNLWLYNSGVPMYPDKLHIPYLDHPCFNRPKEAYKKGVDLQSFVFTKEEKDSLFDHIYANSIARNAPEERKKYTYAAPGLFWSIAFTKHTSVTISNYYGEPFSENENAILLRFANVFEQSYTRFLDLQKAEAQAREAQIEASLERVRSRAMAMQTSEELNALIGTVFTELTKLDLVLTRCVIMINDAKTNDSRWWMANSEAPEQPMNFFVRYHKHPPNLAYLDAWRDRRLKWQYILEGKIKKEWDDFIFAETELSQLPDFVIAGMRQPDRVYLNSSFYNFGNMTLASLEPLSDEHFDILVRFAKVFDLTYTRFNDLKQAEAQAREARIEAALERVRSRAMAMYKTDELLDAAELIYRELSALGVTSMNISYAFVDEKEKYGSYYSVNPVDGKTLPFPFIFPHTETEVMLSLLSSWKKQEPFNVIELDEKATLTHQTYIGEHIHKQIAENNPGIPFTVDAFLAISPKKAVIYNFNFTQGYIFIIGSTHLTTEQEQMLLRFTRVFELTYRRFLDLRQAAAQAREAQIELALERVRARTMAMHKSDELAEVVGLLFKQFEQLGFELYQVLVSIYDTRNNFIEWWSKGFGDIELPQRNIIPIIDHPFSNDLFAKWKSGTEYYAHTLEGELKESWDEYLFTQTDLKHFPQEVKDAMRSIEKVYLSDVFIKYGSLQAAGPIPLPDDKANILKRFAKVLDQAYTRMKDLQNAEAQAREAKIEAALEKVRARAMAMQTSEDVVSATSVLFSELDKLGIKTMRCGILVIEESQRMEVWTSVFTKDAQVTKIVGKLDMTIHPLLAGIFRSWKQKDEIFSYKLIGDDIHKYYSALAKAYDPYSALAQDPNMPDHYCHVYFYEEGGLYTFSVDAHNEETKQIIKKFTAVFSLTFRRYQDLKQAEAQAREARIETALEKVRGRSLAMHKSDELQEVVNTVFERLEDLNIEMDSANIAIFKEGSRDYDYWIASHFQKRAASFHMPYLDLSLTRDIIAARESGTDFSAASYPFEIKNEWFDYAFKNTDFRFLTEERKQFILSAPAIMVAIAFSKHTGVQINRYSGILPSEGEIDILKRFSKVFEQAYIRFLDLEKAEAQANEARIEIALERIRARALAMHKSDELMEVAKVLWEQMALLGQPELEASVVHLYEEDPDHIHSWRAVSIGKNANTNLTYGHMAIPKYSCEVVREWLEKFYSDLKEYTIEISGEKQKEWYDLLFKLAPDVINSMREKKDIHDKRYYRFSKFSGGALLMVSKQEPSAEVTYLQGRAAVVFDLAYRRFSDLQKAEAQAREAQIEAALERTRTQSMLMQHSNELDITSRVFHEQLLLLNIDSEFSYVWLPDVVKNKHLFWAAWSEEQNGSTILQSKSATYDLDKTEPYTAECFRAWESDEPIHIYPVASTEVKNFFDLWSEIMGDAKKLKPEFFPDGIYYDEAFMKYGCFGIVIRRLLTEDEKKILLRFTIEFERTYTRFLDLQKAEAQSREAKIEAALEKVRASAMAMHNSEHVSEATAVLFSELEKLGIETMRCGIVIIHENQTMETWAATTTDDKKNVIRISGLLDMTKHPLLIGGFKGWKNKEESYTYHLAGKDMENYYDFLAESPFYPIPKQRPDMPEHDCTLIYFKEGGLYTFSVKPHDEATIQVLKRFSSVFSLTYRRYNDLKNAEAQAREAQIEASLERVRSKTMAMHNSQDVGETVGTMFDELVKLGVETTRCGVGIMQDDYQMELWTAKSEENGVVKLIIGTMDMKIHPLLTGVYESWIKKEKHYSYQLKDEDLIAYYNAINNQPNYPIQYDINTLPSQIFQNTFGFNEGILFAFSLHQLTGEASQIFRRFAGVFGQTYRRYLDLQKAEAQAKEAKIEASLERVRAKAMAMHSSKDLSETLTVFYRELKSLGVIPRRCGIALMDKEERLAEVTTMNTTEQGDSIEVIGQIWMSGHKILEEVYENWVKQNEYHVVLRGNEIKEYYQVLKPQMDFPDYPHDVVQYGYYFMFNEGDVYAWTENELTEDELKIYRRFTTVISLTYKRYKDLQQAEAQAREAQIETGLERVRARTMAMHSSDDVSAATATMFTELEKLGIENFRGGIAILLPNRTQEVWSVNNLAEGKIVKAVGTFNIDDHSFWQHMYSEWGNKKEFLHYFLAGKDKEDFVKILAAAQNYLPQSIQQFPDVHFQVYFFGDGAVWTNSLQPHSEEDQQLMKRFTSVFSLTFRRYQDLKKAEAQAREAQIEAGLERVRARTMAMHSSDDVNTATATMFTELEKLGIESFRGGILNIRADQTMDVWSVNNLAEGKIVRAAGEFDMTMHPFWQQLYKGWVNKDEVLYFNMSGKDKEDYIRILDARRDYLPGGMQELPDSHIQSYYFGEGFVWTFTLQPHPEEDKQVMKKFASVFSLTFRRYQDLKKAEAQAREATIEAALERVRGKAMAMHSSKDLATTIGVFYHELEGLNLTPRRCGVGLIDKETQTAEISTMNAAADGQGIELVGKLDMRSHPVLKGIYNNWLAKTEYHPVLHGNEIKEYYQVVRPQIDFPDYPNDSVQYGYFFFFEEGGVYAWTEKELNEEELKIYRRFTSVLSLTYKRYKDLKDAELRTQIAIKDAALDRIRADIASMRTINDLDRITPLIWNELTILGIPFIRCGVFIMDEEQQLIHTFLSTPDGKAIAAFHLPYDTPGNLREVIINWKQKQKYIDHWDETEFVQFADILVKQGALDSAELYLKTIPKGGFHLHFLPFLQGMLYVGNTTQLKEEEIELIQHVADAFSTAYARYEDFNKLEAAKQQVEKTLTDLKQAQQQLVQSEKMASLGELTAGIAHEIQNPLNFVNNFSDVSNELLEEMKTELEKGNAEDAMAIVEDIKQNLEKILHHGKRADAIVKGMLQHSRTSSGQKEPTDINVLAEEYLRLSFHGLRAKDKSFNAKFETEFDNTIGKINVIPQDIGRVILNLINNAFYAVTEKKKQNSNGYDPIVTVYTKKVNDKIEIKVKDNGNGIPQKVLEKIFQPFFTTKPTGQGTGLGLSLSYDIVTKGHGGELKVETKEGEGSEFIIQLPTN